MTWRMQSPRNGRILSECCLLMPPQLRNYYFRKRLDYVLWKLFANILLVQSTGTCHRYCLCIHRYIGAGQAGFVVPGDRSSGVLMHGGKKCSSVVEDARAWVGTIPSCTINTRLLARFHLRGGCFYFLFFIFFPSHLRTYGVVFALLHTPDR